MKEPVLKTEHLTHIYGENTPFRTVALKDVCFAAYPGEYIGLVGHTGSGKSTLIQHLNGLMKPTSGAVLLEGTDIHTSKKTLRDARFKVGLVFQYPEYQLFEETVYQDIAFGPKNMGLSAKEVDGRVHRAAGFAGITEDMLRKSPFDLSGGEKRRVAIAGVIAMEPEVLILDEPLAGLDPQGCRDILSHIEAYHRAANAVILLVTHSMEAAATSAQRIVVMDHGEIAMDGAPGEIFSHGEELRRLGLAVPVSTQIILRLRELGLPVDPSVFTVGQAAEAIAALKGGR